MNAADARIRLLHGGRARIPRIRLAPKLRREFALAALLAAGFLLATAGVLLIYLPAGLIFAGGLLLALTFAYLRGEA